MLLKNKAKYTAILSTLLLGTAFASAEDDIAPQERPKRLREDDKTDDRDRSVYQRTNKQDLSDIERLSTIAKSNIWTVMKERGVKKREYNAHSAAVMKKIVDEIDAATNSLIAIADNTHESVERRIHASNMLVKIFNYHQQTRSTKKASDDGFPIPVLRIHDKEKTLKYAKLSFSLDNTNTNNRLILLSGLTKNSNEYRKLAVEAAENGSVGYAREVLKSYFVRNLFQIDLEKACQYFEFLWSISWKITVDFQGISFTAPEKNFLDEAFKKPGMFDRLRERALESGNINNAIAFYLVLAKTETLPASSLKELIDCLIPKIDSVSTYQNIPLLCQKLHTSTLPVEENIDMYLRYYQFRRMINHTPNLARFSRTLPVFNANQFIKNILNNPSEDLRQKASQPLTELLDHFILKKQEIDAYNLLCEYGKVISETQFMKDFYNKHNAQSPTDQFVLEGLIASYNNDEKSIFNRTPEEEKNRYLLLCVEFIRRQEYEKAVIWKDLLVEAFPNLSFLDDLLQGDINAAYKVYNFLNTNNKKNLLIDSLCNLNKECFFNIAVKGGCVQAKVDLALRSAKTSTEILETLHLLETADFNLSDYTIKLEHLYWNLYDETTGIWLDDEHGLEAIHHVFSKFLSIDQGSLFSSLFHENQEDISDKMIDARAAAANIILRFNPYVNISEENPHYIKALEFLLAHDDLTQGLENPYTEHKKLIDARNTPVNLQELATGDGFLTIDANALSTLSNGMEIDTSVLPTIEWHQIETTMNGLEQKSKTPEVNEKIKKTLAFYSGNEEFEFINLKSIVSGLNEQSYYYTQLTAPKETMQSAQLKCILSYIFSFDNSKNKADLTPQEKGFVKIFCQINACQTGKESMIDDYYRTVLPSEHKLVKMKNPEFENDIPRVREKKIFITDIITQAMKGILAQDTPFMQRITGTNDNTSVEQLSHQSFYLLNLIGHSIGLPDTLRFDPNILCVLKPLREAPKAHVLKEFFKYTLSGDQEAPFIKEIQRVVNHLILKDNNYLILKEMTDHWTYLDDDNGTPQIKPEGVLDLLRFMKIIND